MRGERQTCLDGKRADEVVEDIFGVDPSLNSVEGEHVYVLELEDDLGRDWYYVGASGVVFNRIVSHTQGIRTPYWSDRDVRVVGVECIEHVTEDSKRHQLTREARRREHEKYIEVVREKNTTRVIGGK